MDRKICVIPWRRRQRGRGSCSRWSATELGMRGERMDLEDKRERNEDMQVAYLLPLLEWPVGLQGSLLGLLG